MTRLLLDEMLSPGIAERLRTAGVDVVCISERPDLRGLPDPEVLDLAAHDSRVLVTENIQDFRPLEIAWAEQGRTHPGILYVSTKTFPVSRRRSGRLVAALLARQRSDGWPGAGGSDFLG